MSFKDKLLDFKRRLSDRRMYSIILVAAAVIASAGIYQYKKALDYQNYLNNQYNRAFHEVVDYVENLEVSLAKAMLVNSPRQMDILSSEIWRQAAFAQANLGQLPISHVQLDKTSKFLTQVGDYSYSLSTKTADGQQITDKESSQLERLHKYATSLSKILNDMENELYAGDLKFGEMRRVGRTGFSRAAKTISTQRMENIEKQFQEYPSLIYDGPFSDHVEKMKPRLLQGGTKISKERAREIAEKFLGKDRIKDLEYIGEGNGTIQTYRFAANPAGRANDDRKDRRITINITKIDGHVLWMLDNRDVARISLNMDQAKQKARDFLESRGIENMKETYHLKEAGVATINYAYVQDDVIMYPDLVKVKVALDSGSIVGFESKGYVMAHKAPRELPPVKITEEAARAQINDRLKVDRGRLAVIPLESKREVLCYEFKGSFNNKKFLIYINVETGKEEKILMLLETPDGTMTM